MNRNILPNSPESLAPQLTDSLISSKRVWGMLVLRSILSFFILLLLALVFKLNGKPITHKGLLCLVAVVRYHNEYHLHPFTGVLG